VLAADEIYLCSTSTPLEASRDHNRSPGTQAHAINRGRRKLLSYIIRTHGKIRAWITVHLGGS
jgi:hypothetical protein